MNYLSHLYLSQRTPASLIGNLMGDFKPSAELCRNLPEAVLRGIENHRLVDRLTDHFAPVRQLKPLFSAQRRRYAGIITDIVFDYFLIKHWDANKDGDFDEFIGLCYHALLNCQHWMPPRMQYVTQQMVQHDWLRAYATLTGIGQSIDQVSKRLRYKNNMRGAIEEVEQHYQQIEACFQQLFVHLDDEVKKHGRG